MDRKRIRGRGGFTLVELLVVMAVICILAALLLPAVRGAQERVNRSVCMEHLRQTGAIFNLAAADHDDWYPGGDWGTAYIVFCNCEETGRVPKCYTSIELIADYGMEKELTLCPSQKGYVGNGNWVWGISCSWMHFRYIGGYGHCGAGRGRSYGWFDTYLWGPDPWIKPVPKATTAKYPKRNPFMFDFAYDEEHMSSYWGYPSRSNHSNEDGTAYGENILYADMHVDWVPLQRGFGPRGRFFRCYYDLFEY